MASVLDLVKHYQHAIEKYSDDERKVLKCIDKLFHLNVTVQHLQETGVGRTVNALRKEPGNIGQASRALVNKWKCMVAAEESDNEPEHNNDASQHNGHGNGKDSDRSANNSSASRTKHNDSTSSTKSSQEDYSKINGGHSGSKRKYRSSEDEETHTKKSKHNSSSDTDDYKKPSSKVKVEHNKFDNQDTSQSDDSDSDSSQSSIDEKPQQKVKHEPKEKSSSRHSQNNVEDKRESSSTKKTSDSDRQSSHRSRHSSEKPKDSHHKHSSSKEKENGTEKKHKSDHKTDIDKRHKTENGSSSKHSEDKHRSSLHRSESSSDKQKSDKSRSDKHRSSSQSNKTEKEKHKPSDKDASEKRKDGSSSKHSSSKDRKDNSREKSSSHKSDKSHSSSSESKSKSDKKEKNYDKDESKHKSSSSRSSKSSKTKEDIPKNVNGQNDSDDGIDCGSGASFAEALGMVSPAKSKKKPLKDLNSPSNPFNNIDLSPASLLAPNAKLAPLPLIEISALPEISPNYKPRPPPKLMPHFTDEDAMSHVISSKNQRTKVYSGNKVYGKLPSLYELCVNVLQEHIDALEFTGGVPYDILKPVVDRATPQQLFMLEHYNPYLMEDTDHLWKGFCERSFRNKKRQEMESWREMFIRCQEEQESKLKSLTANIKMTQEARKAPIKQTKMAYVDSVVKPPRNIARKQAQHGTAHAAAASPAARVASLAAAPNLLKGGVRPPPAAPVSLSTFNKPKKAPLMQKALQFMRGRKR